MTTPHRWWKWYAGTRHGDGVLRHLPRDLTLDALWEVEERLLQEFWHQGLAHKYQNAMPADHYSWHATPEQKIKALAAVLRPLVEREEGETK
jgi:hypothetical protein